MTNGAFGSTRTAALERVGMAFPLLESHVATTVAVARCMEYADKRSAHCPSRHESYRHLETSTLPYMVVVGQVSVDIKIWQLGCGRMAHPLKTSMRFMPGPRPQKVGKCLPFLTCVYPPDRCYTLPV